tara:strand:+ start:1591 stop:2175 length:585 start_codon:yes stop_codon:yes gene_type:complete
MSQSIASNWKSQIFAASGVLVALILLTHSFGKAERRRNLDDLSSNLQDAQRGYDYINKKKVIKGTLPKVSTLKEQIAKLTDELTTIQLESKSEKTEMIDLARNDLIDELMTKIVTNARQKELKITSIQNIKNTSDNVFTQSRESRSISMQGGFLNLIHYFESLSKQQHTVIIRELTIVKSDQPHILSININLLI